MPCYKPLTAWYSKQINAKTGKRSLVFSSNASHEPEKPLEVPCGQCIGCRIERSRQWALRCVHEASLWERNCFITLTFDEENLAERDNPMSLDVKEWQRFMKRLRKKFGNNIRFFHCGEYGDTYKRPHYHACLFNFDFDDKQLWTVTKTGEKLYISESLQKLWTHGFSTIGAVTWESAAYVARYIMKKVNGDMALEHYNDIDWETGEVLQSRAPEYTTMSRRPGIAAGWFEKYEKDVYPKDFVVVNGKKMKPPKFYDRIMERTRPYEFTKIKEKREKKLKEFQATSNDLGIARLKVRERVQELKAKRLVRNHDKGIK